MRYTTDKERGSAGEVHDGQGGGVRGEVHDGQREGLGAEVNNRTGLRW